MITLKDIAARSGYSLATVSRVINNNRPVNPDIREQVLAVAKELNYIPNTAARTLAKRRTDSIGVVVSNLHDPFFHDLILGFEAGATETSYNVVFCSAMGSEMEQKRRYVRYLSNGVVDGIVLYGSYHDDEDMVRELHGTGFPFVLIESVVEGVDTMNFLIDNQSGVYGAVRYLHRHGHRKIAYIAGKQDKKVAVDRLEGYRRAVRDLALYLPDRYIQYVQHGQQDGLACMANLLELPAEQLPTAVLCYDDAVASHVIRCAQQAGLRVPQDLSVMGFDNQTIPPDGYAGPPITSVSQPLFDMGYDSILLLTRYLQGKPIETMTKTYPTQIAEKGTVDHYRRG